MAQQILPLNLFPASFPSTPTDRSKRHAKDDLRPRSAASQDISRYAKAAATLATRANNRKEAECLAFRSQRDCLCGDNSMRRLNDGIR